nr:hypothetical protein [Tanacetum cinerariifolium]
MNDLYNNLKVYEPEVKWISSSSSSTQSMAFVSSSNNNTNNTNGTLNTAHRVSTASTKVNASYSTNIDNLSDAVICLFFASQPNSPQLIHEDFKQIHPDDMEEMYLRWQIAMLTMRAIRFLKKTGRKLTVNENETIGFNKSNVEFYNCHKRGQFCYGLWYHVMVLVDMNEVIRQRKGLIMHSWLSLLQVLTQSLDEFVNKPVVKNCKAKSSEEEPKVVRKNNDALIIEKWVSDNEEEDVSQPKIMKKTVRPSITKLEFVKSKRKEKTARKTIKQVEQHRQTTHSPRGNQRNWNTMMS